MPRGGAAKAFRPAPMPAGRPAPSTVPSSRTAAVCCTRSITTPSNTAGLPQHGPQNVIEVTREFPFCARSSAGTGLMPAGVLPVSTRWELAMRLMPTIAAAALLVLASAGAMAANPTRIAETGAYLLGNAHRCGVADERV